MEISEVLFFNDVICALNTDKVFDTIIPRLIRLVEAPSHGEPINEYDPTSRAAEAYMNLAKEVIDRDGNE